MTGRVLQLYYTSCEMGLSGHAGFQVRAASDDLSPDDRRELEGVLLYEAPRNMPRDPDPETIAAEFPVALRIVTLASGRRAIVRSNYVGQDYSGRWGNYFAHALVLDVEDRHDAERSLVDAFAWPGWQTDLDADAGRSPPRPLPPISLDEVLADTSYSCAELGTFLSEGDARADRLAEMIHAVCRRPKDSRSLVIRELHDMDGRYWVACVLKSFPPGCQRALTASTYQASPRSCLAVNATSGDTDFLFDDAERRFQFYMFDFQAAKHSEVPAEPGEYAACVAEWMVKDPARIEGLHEFSRAFELPDVTVDLESLLLMYRAELGDGRRISKQELSAITTFAQERTRPEYFGSILKTISALSAGMDRSTPAEDWTLLLSCLAKGAHHTGEAADRAVVCRTWLRVFDLLVGEPSASLVAPIVTLRGDIEKQLGVHAPELSSAFLGPAHFNGLLELASYLPASALAIVLGQTLQSLAGAAGPAAMAPEVVSLLNAAFRGQAARLGQVRWALEPFKNDPDSLAAVVKQFAVVEDDEERAQRADQDDQRTALRSVGGLLSELLAGDPDARRVVLTQLKEDWRAFPILAGEWERSITTAADKLREHHEYSRAMLSDQSDFTRQYRDWMTQWLLTRLLPTERQEFARAMLASPDFSSYPEVLATNLLAIAADAVSFVLVDTASDTLALRIRRECDQRKLAHPERLALRAAVTQAVDGARPDTRPLRSCLRTVTGEQYRELLDAILPKLVNRSKDTEELKNTLELLSAGNDSSVLASVYVRFHADRPATRFDNLDLTTLLFWLGLRASDPAARRIEHLRRPILDYYADRLAAMKRSMRHEMIAEVEANPDFEKYMHDRWTALVTRADPPPFGMIGKMIGKVFGPKGEHE